ncbi:MAG: UTP--glucose-1-phosphate uridylyltransferase GalU [Peptococcaceae bacterium]|jgi:UTP--glucose-1-phosphate uridylyltransferase|nr:UTP--glucose-1-phosphate uridylyltransferase GalU [Peptococcaceae bacterium]MBQ2449616.1 UTP--glucose-1-phosphate uridylyltransferase GalU [Peptococcaceae bacterium]MBQ5703044.1 UTP--glucose-1-phosphate uridylyltransferase GalU [Peptococcaceae bacterium]MBQ5859090.1 UTP--glucose-1-phosphate uridylyltransferase GalU [Peptococcaceae bacterium]
MPITKAVIPAAGLGTRFLPATKAQPKEMLPIVDKPTIQYIIEEAAASGITDILIITGRNKRAIEDHFDRSIELEMELERKHKDKLLQEIKDISNIVNIQYIRQQTPKGLGHAVLCAKNFVGNEPFAVLLGDDVVDSNVPCLKQLMNVYDRYNSSVLGVQQVSWNDVDKYGIVSGEVMEDGIHKVKTLFEKPDREIAPSNVAILGRYIITPDIFPILEHTEPGAGLEIQLTDALKELARHKAVYAYEFAGCRYDVGDKLGFLKATVEMALKRPDLHDDFAAYLRSLNDGGLDDLHC